MPITIGPNVNPSLMGQAGLAIGQGDLARWQAELAARYGNRQPQQQPINLYPNGAPSSAGKPFGSDSALGLARGFSGDVPAGGGGDSSEAPPSEQPVVDPEETERALYTAKNAELYGGIDNYDPESQQSIKNYFGALDQIQNDDKLDQSHKDDATMQLQRQFYDAKQKLGGFNGLRQTQSMDDYMKANSTTLPDGSTVIRGPDGKLTHIAPKQQDDPQFPPPADVAAGSVNGPPTPEDVFKQSTYTAPDGTVYTQTKSGWKMLGKPPAPPKPVKDEISAHELADLEMKYMKMTDKDGNPMFSEEEAQQKAADVLKRHQALTGRSTQGSAKVGNSPIDHEAQQIHEDSLQTVNSHDDYAKIPPGTPYKDADGNIRVKSGSRPMPTDPGSYENGVFTPAVQRNL